MSRVSDAFDAVATEYDGARRRLILEFDAFYGNLLDLVAEQDLPAEPRVLDLGAGTGLLAALVRERLPTARLHLVDLAGAMLDQARARFGDDPRVTYSIADYTSGPLGGPYDVVVSALSIHHVPDAGKRRLFRRVLEALVPGGLFVDADQVLAPTPNLERRAHQRWREQAAALGSDPEEIAAAEGRMSHDRCARLEDQLAWLREAGFTDVDCSWKSWRFAVFGGRRP
ncbi:MAG: methyltransferase domain-containing protein [Geminicoccaceae bacterium]